MVVVTGRRRRRGGEVIPFHHNFMTTRNPVGDRMTDRTNGSGTHSAGGKKGSVQDRIGGGMQLGRISNPSCSLVPSSFHKRNKCFVMYLFVLLL